MSKKVHESYLKISGDNKSGIAAIDGVAKKMGAAERSIKGFGSGIGGTLGSISASFTSLPFLASTAAAGAAYGFANMVKSSINTAESIQKMSQRIGVSTEALSTLRHAAELSGTDIGVFEKAVERLSRNVDDASRGIGDGKKAFDDLGISVVNTDGSLVDAETILKKVADKFVGMEDGTKKTALALQLFGRAGADLIPMLNGGSVGLAQMQQKARDLGLEISTETANAAANLKDEMLNLSRSFDGFANRTAPVVISSLSNILDGFNDIIDATDNSSNAVEFFFSMHTNAMLDGIKNAAMQHNKALLEAITLAENQARAKAKDLNSEELKKLVAEQKNIIGSLNKLDKNEDVENTIKQKEAQLKIYESLLNGNKEIIKQKQLSETLARQWEDISKKLNNEIATIGLPKVYQEFIKINQEVDELHAKFGDNVLLDQYESKLLKMWNGFDKLNPILTPSYSESDTTGSLQPVEFDTTLYDAQKNAIAEVTNWDMINYAAREGAAQEMFGNMSQAAYNFYQLGGKQAKTAFAAYKAFAIGETVMSTYRAATAALEPPPTGLGPLWGIPLAASTIALGLSNVARIASATPGSTGSGNINAGIPQTQPTNNYNNNNSTSNVQNVTIKIDSGWQDPDELVRKLIPAFEKFVSYGGTIKIN